MRIAVSWATHTQTRTWYNSALRISLPTILLTNALPPRTLSCGCCFMNQLANNLADLLRDLNKFDEAEMLMRVVLSGLEDILGADHPNTKIACENLEDLLDARRAQEEGRDFHGVDDRNELPMIAMGGGGAAVNNQLRQRPQSQ